MPNASDEPGDRRLRVGSLFSGYGGLDLAVEEVFDARTIWFSEINEPVARVFAHHWPDAPNLGDITQRLREWNDRIRSLEASLVDLENERMSANEQPEVDPAEAAEVLRDIVLNCEDPKKLREFVGSFVREITVNDSEVVVDYHPECLVRHNHRAKIHSAEKWLPVLGSLRTVRLTIVRPARFTVGKQDVVLTLAA